MPNTEIFVSEKERETTWTAKAAKKAIIMLYMN